MKRPSNEFFTTSLYEIERVTDHLRTPPDDPENSLQVQEKLPLIYQAYQDVFSKTAAEKIEAAGGKAEVI